MDPYPPGAQPDGAGRRRWWSTFALSLVGFFAIGAPWAYNTPIGSFPDEYYHAYYARAVTTGQMLTEGRTDTRGLEYQLVKIPARLRIEAVDGGVSCYANHPDVPAGCSHEPAESDGPVSVRIFLARYPPAFYALTGLPLFLSDAGVDSGHAIYLISRFTGLLASATLLASAVATAGRKLGSRRSFAVGLIAVMPMGIYSSAGLNPQGVEIFAAAALALHALAVREHWRSGEDVRGAAWGAAISYAVLINTRPISLVIGLVVACALATAVVRSVRDGVRLLRVSIGPAVVVVATSLVSVVYFVWVYTPAFRPNAKALDAFRGYGAVDRVLRAAARVDQLFPEYVIVVGWLDTWPPTVVHVAWYAFIAVVVAFSWRAARELRSAIVILGFAAVVMPIGLMAASGLRWQGRYSLPLIAPALVLALGGLASAGIRRHDPKSVDRLLRFGVALVVATSAIAMYWTIIRFSYGLAINELFPTIPVPRGEALWTPPLGLVAGSTVATVGFAIPLVVFVLLGRQDTVIATHDARHGERLYASQSRSAE